MTQSTKERAPGSSVDTEAPDFVPNEWEQKMNEDTSSPEEAPQRPETAQEQAEKQAEQEVQYKDAEILGKSYAVRRSVLATARRAVWLKEKTIATLKNIKDTPVRWHKNGMYNRAEKKYNSKKRKYEAVENKDSRLAKYRKAKMDAAQRRMNARLHAKNSHIQMMENRHKTVADNHEERKKQTIDKYKSKKQDALLRKQMRRELRSQGAGVLERHKINKEILEQMSPNERQRMGRVAASVELSARASKKAGRESARQESIVDSTERHIKATETRIDDYAAKIGSSEAKVAEKHNELPDAESAVSDIQSRLNEMSQDDPSYEGIEMQLVQAQDKLNALNKEIEELQRTVEEARRKKKDAELSLEQAKEQLERDKESSAAASASYDTARKTHEQFAQEFSDQM